MEKKRVYDPLSVVCHAAGIKLPSDAKARKEVLSAVQSLELFMILHYDRMLGLQWFTGLKRCVCVYMHVFICVCDV